jgi:hypothetical protein
MRVVVELVGEKACSFFGVSHYIVSGNGDLLLFSPAFTDDPWVIYAAGYWRFAQALPEEVSDEAR